MVNSDGLDPLSVLSRYLIGRKTLSETLTDVVEMARAALGADMAGITMLVDERPTTAVYTDPEAPAIDAHQYEPGGGGPCMEAFRTGQMIAISSVLEDRRWPRFSDEASSHGVSRTLSAPLWTLDEPVGALNVYWRTSTGSPDPEGEARVATDFAAQAAVVLANAQAYSDAREMTQNLQEALKSRATIDQAIGILMGQTGHAPEEAFELLKKASQRENRKLRDIAADLVARSSARRAEGPGPG